MANGASEFTARGLAVCDHPARPWPCGRSKQAQGGTLSGAHLYAQLCTPLFEGGISYTETVFVTPSGRGEKWASGLEIEQVTCVAQLRRDGEDSGGSGGGGARTGEGTGAQAGCRR